MENPKIVTELEYNKYTEKTGCPSLRTILAYQDISEKNNVIPQILTFADVERISRTLDFTGIKDPETKRRIELGKAFLPANLDFQLFLYKFYDTNIPNQKQGNGEFINFSTRTESGMEIKKYTPSPKEDSNIPSQVIKIPSTPKEFFQVHQEMKREGIDAILRCIGNLRNADFSFNIAKGEGFSQLGDSLEEIMTSPNKPILIDLIPDNELERFKKETIERYNRKIAQTYEEPQILRGIDYEHPLYRLNITGKSLIRYIMPYNDSNLYSVQLLLADKLVTFLSNMHAQVPAIKEKMKEQEANKIENERIKRNTILQTRKEAEEDERRLKEIDASSKAKKRNPHKFPFPIMF